MPMRKSFLLSCLFILVYGGLHAQLWGKNTESEFTNEANDLAVDPNGNTYVAGYITGETAFEVTVVQPNAQGNGDIYIAKYNAAGTLIWIRQFGGSNSDRAIDIATDNAGFVYVTGQFFGTVDFDGNIIQANGNSKNIFLVKLSPAGTALWAISEGGSGEENAYGVTTDQQNNVILTGQFAGNSTIAGQNFTSMNEPVNNLPSNDLFISKYDTNGNPLWVKVGIAEYEDRGTAVSCDDQNNILLIGQFSDTLDFNGQIINNGGYNVGFLTKLNPSGQTQWFRMIKAGMILPYGVAVNSSNEVVVTGDYLGTLQYTDPNGTSTIPNNYYRKVFALKTDSNGYYIWGNSLGSNNELSARSVAINDGKDIFITGHFKCDLSQLHDPQPSLFNSVGFRDVYLWHINNQGASVYVKQTGGKKDDQGKGVALLNNLPIICGSYTEDLNIPSSPNLTYTTSSQDFSLQNYYSPYEISHFFLHGDDSRNSFLTNAIQSTTFAYDYFDPQGIDSLLGYISDSLFGQDMDTIHICVSDSIYYTTNTFPHYGPAYSYLWNTGSIIHSTYVTSSGLYDLYVERIDECSNDTDSVIVIIHQLPDLPLMSDSLGLAINEPGINYYTYHYCAPAAIPIWFNDLDSNVTITINGSGAFFTDTLVHTYSNDGTYSVVVADQYCSNDGYFSIDLDYSPPHDVIPYMVLHDEIDYNDSITICQGNSVEVLILDAVTNPNGDFNLEPNDPVADFDWSVQPGSITGLDTFDLQFQPTISGWYTVTYFASLGYDNLCGVDTTNYLITDSFYVEVLATPVAPAVISGDNLLCPDGSVYLTISPTYPTLNWSGPAINWTSPGEDTVQVTEQGVYHYGGLLVDSITGCSDWFDFTFTLIEKSPPNIQANPADGIICPNDSVTMSVNAIYLDYNWFGPSGDSLSLTSTHTDEEQGFYYVTVTDADNCSLTSPPFEIREYSTPYLTVEPSNILCGNNTITISAIFDGSGQVNWTSPMISNSPQLIVNQGGWYVCEMTQCGITVVDSVYIIDGTFNPSLTVSDSVLCYGEQAIISAPPGMSNYEWSNGEMGVASINTDQDGSFYAILTNAYGCIATTNTVTIDVIDGSAPPIISDVNICVGSNLLITNTSTTQWYTTDTTFLSSGVSFFSNTITSDTSFLAAYLTAQCPLSFAEITVNVVDSLPLYTMESLLGVCVNDSISLSVNTNGENVSWIVDGVIFSTNDSITIYGGDITNNVIQVEISNTCFSYTLSDTINLYTPQTINLVNDSLIHCAEADISLSLDTNLSFISWSGYFGQSDSIILQLPTPIASGYVYVQGVDVNGCSTNTDSIFVQTVSLTVGILDDINLNCEGDSVTLESNEYGASFEWNTPNGILSDSVLAVVVDLSNQGWYQINVADTFGCTYTDSVFIGYNPLPEIVMPDDTIICMGDYLGGDFYVDSFSYTWGGFGIIDSVMMMQDGMYYLVVEGSNGCIYTDSINVDAVNCEDELPNVITPNNDGINDFFLIDEVSLFPNNTLIIVNRWGNVVYRQDGYNNTFNGDNLVDGTYFYTFYREGVDYPTDYFEGHLTIIR